MAVKFRQVVFMGAEIPMEAGRAEIMVQRGQAQYAEVAKSLADAKAKPKTKKSKAKVKPRMETAEAAPEKG